VAGSEKAARVTQGGLPPSLPHFPSSPLPLYLCYLRLRVLGLALGLLLLDASRVHQARGEKGHGRRHNQLRVEVHELGDPGSRLLGL